MLQQLCLGSVPSMALYFFSISTMRGGPGGPLAVSGTDGLSSRLSHSDMESVPTFLTSDFCNVVSNVRKMSRDAADSRQS